MTGRVLIRAARPADYATVLDRCSGLMVGARAIESQAQAATFWYEEQPVALFGATLRWPGVADLWGLVAADAYQARFGLVRACRSMLEAYAREVRLRRLAAWVHAGEPHCLRFAQAMGFMAEYTDRGAAPDGGDLVTVVRRWTRG